MITILNKSRSFQLALQRKARPGNLSHTATKASSIGHVDETQRHEIQWQTSSGIMLFEALDGETLRTAALRRGLISPHNGRARLINCRGLGTCGTCAVEIQPQINVFSEKRNAVERARLHFPPHGGANQSPNLRLACQVQIRGDIVVTKRTGFWGQYDSVAEASKAETYFGNLEFVLDRKSPSVPSTFKD
jgi:ferredoxin